MALRKICTHKRAFTLIEVLVVLGIFACMSSVLLISPDLYRGYSTRSARDMLVVSLMHARAQTMNGVCLAPQCLSAQAHGLHIDAPSGHLKDAVFFEGPTYDLADPLNKTIDFSHISQHIFYTGPAEISFAALSGDTIPTTLALSDGVATSTITLGSEGQIAWTP